MSAINPPVFIRAIGRTGGTLLNTMLDAHHAVAMSYEIYQDRLIGEDGQPLTPRRAIELIIDSELPDRVRWVRSIPDRNLRVFVARARRGDVEPEELAALLAELEASGGSFETIDDRVHFIEQLMLFKMKKHKKQYWGGKVATVEPELLHQRHGEASFLAMVRDGRDVLASQMMVGRFDASPQKVAFSWRRAVKGFREFGSRPGVRAREVRYESLVREPQNVLTDICEWIGISFDQAMVEFQLQDLSLWRNPHGHLSFQQLTRGLNPDSIGRWQRDLTSAQVGVFEDVNRDLLEELGYAVGKEAR